MFTTAAQQSGLIRALQFGLKALFFGNTHARLQAQAGMEKAEEGGIKDYISLVTRTKSEILHNFKLRKLRLKIIIFKSKLQYLIVI